MEGKSTDWVRGPSGPTVCRCCFAEGCYKDISTEYFWMGKREVYAEMLTETFDLSIAFAQTMGPNSNSRLICEPCISRLRDASEFKRQVQECEKMFMQYLDPGRITLDSVVESTPEPLEKEVKLERVKLEKGHSDDDFDDRGGFDDLDDDDLDDQPLTKLASKVPKKESVDLLDLLDNAKVAEKRKSTSKAKATPAKKAKTKKETPKATASKAKPEKKKKDLNGWRSVEKAARRNARIILTYSTAYPVKCHMANVECYVCHSLFDDPNLFRIHMDKKHANIDRSKIIAPYKLGSTRVDITNLRCKSCKTNFDNIETLVTHMNAIHQLNIDETNPNGLVPLKLEKDRYQCLICSKVFISIKQLSMHTGTHFYKYICDFCGNKYETPGGIDLHIRSIHQQSAKGYRCKLCNTSFPTAEAKSIHLKTTKQCAGSMCQICNERFFTWQQREDHLVEVHKQEKKEFRCKECDQVFKFRYYLVRHFKTAHTNENKCTFCYKQFAFSTQLRDHITKHTGEKPYKCTHCDLRFRCKKAWNRHLVTHDDAKKASCPVCFKKFARRYRIKFHVEKHHPEYKGAV